MIDPLSPTAERLLYTAGPITPNVMGDTPEFVSVAQLIATALRKLGWAVVCPHMNSLTIDGGTLDDYLKEDFRIIRGCDAVVLLPNWQHSNGSKAEIDFASKRGIPVFSYRAFLPDWKG